MKILNLKAHLLTTEGIDPEEIEIRVHPTQVLAWGERNEASFPELRVYIMLTSNRETYALKMTAVEFEKLLVDAISDPNEPGGILNATRTFDFWKGFPTPSSDGMKEFESGIAMSLSRDGAKLIGPTIIPSSTPGK